MSDKTSPNPHAASTKLVEHGKVEVPFTLESHQRAFEAFYQAHGQSSDNWVGGVWDEYVSLLEKMSYMAHFTDYHPDTKQWMLEDVCGTDSWVSFDPNDYFSFALSA